MSETMKVILTIITVGIALAALIVNSIGNMRADMRENMRDIRSDMRDMRGDMHDIREEVSNNRAEIGVLRTEINGLRTEIDGLRTEINGLRMKMDKFGRGLQALTDRVTHVETLLQGRALPSQDVVARTQKG